MKKIYEEPSLRNVAMEAADTISTSFVVDETFDQNGPEIDSDNLVD